MNSKEKFYLVRSYSGGVWFGQIKYLRNDVCILKNARNIWSWSGASCLSQIANYGIKNGKIGSIIDDDEGVYITQVCNVIPITESALEKLKEIKPWTV